MVGKASDQRDHSNEGFVVGKPGKASAQCDYEPDGTFNRGSVAGKASGQCGQSNEGSVVGKVGMSSDQGDQYTRGSAVGKAGKAGAQGDHEPDGEPYEGSVVGRRATRAVIPTGAPW